MKNKVELRLTAVCILLTLTASVLTVGSLLATGVTVGRSDMAFLVELVVFLLIVLGLVYGGLVYQVSRAGHFSRLSSPYQAVCRTSVDDQEKGPAALAVLIPSYKEELAVLKQTVLSAALLEHTHKRICVLLDDPPSGASADLTALHAARALIDGIDREFGQQVAHFKDAEDGFHVELAAGRYDSRGVADALAALHERAADWFEGRNDPSIRTGSRHVDVFFQTRILREPAERHRRAARELRGLRELPRHEAQHEFRQLTGLFAVRISRFERKTFVNLSHAPNKAMNLNSYIGVMGGTYRDREAPEGRSLEPCRPEDADLFIPSADYLLTLDADSVVLPDYARKLVAAMQDDDRVAVAQTPYSAFPGADAPIERIAGATTDMQYIAHQGTTVFAAAYWVGANALLRYSALKDIEETTTERGHPVSIFIQERTVIEDTGSTVDLIRKGWRIHNHPERLAYSATPPDFGTLTIQRQRWSNGGLIILPDLLRYAFARRGPRSGWTEFFLRSHYLVSPTVANAGLIALLLMPFDARLGVVWLPFTALPYYFCYARDLKQSGYKARDVVGVYALNLLLLPVCLAGVVASVRQLVTGDKAPFARTPKVGRRTATRAGFLAFHLAMMGFLLMASTGDAFDREWIRATFAGMHLSLFAYGFSTLIGWRNARIDLKVWAGDLGRRLRPSPVPVQTVVATLAPAIALGAEASEPVVDPDLRSATGGDWTPSFARRAD